MDISGDYARDGYALLRGLLPRPVCHALLHDVRTGVEAQGARVEDLRSSSALLVQPAAEVYGYQLPQLLGVLWGLTPLMEQLVGRALLPTYNYFRIYREGDLCRVHSDRPACEHSLSVTLDYSDGEPWDLQVGRDRLDQPKPVVSNDFDGGPFAALAMEPGDAVLYEGVHRRHGRITGNPNGWSAHLFCHWVAKDGPYAAHAFDGHVERTRPLNLQFA